MASRVCSDGEKTRRHGTTCGEVYLTYEEEGWYSVHCENCGEMLKIKTKSMDWAIKFWNDCPDAVGRV